MASLDDLEMVLLDSQDGMVPVTNDGAIEFSRCVVSVEADGELTLGVDVWQGDGKAVKYQVRFVPGKAGRSEDICDVGFCKMRFTVAWSLLLNW